MEHFEWGYCKLFFRPYVQLFKKLSSFFSVYAQKCFTACEFKSWDNIAQSSCNSVLRKECLGIIDKWNTSTIIASILNILKNGIFIHQKQMTRFAYIMSVSQSRWDPQAYSNINANKWPKQIWIIRRKTISFSFHRLWILFLNMLRKLNIHMLTIPESRKFYWGCNDNNNKFGTFCCP